jgi:hypothetical protein
MEMVNKDLQERNVLNKRLSDKGKRDILELVLREEEEWQQMVMYRRDQRFRGVAETPDGKLELDRVVLDMLHCPMRMHEKVLNLLYAEILNGKTKNEANGPRKASKRKKKVAGEGAVGQEVAKVCENEQGLAVLQRGVVIEFTEDGGGPRYSVAYDDGDGEDLNGRDFMEAHKLALLLETDKAKEEARVLKVERKMVAPALRDLTDVIRDLGSLGETWTHQWDEGNTKQLKKIKLPFDQSKKIFNAAQLPKLRCAVDIAVPAMRGEHRADWKLMLEYYVSVIGKLTTSEDFSTEDVDELEREIDKFYVMFLKVAGLKGVTNYFHYLGSGHIVWLTRRYGNLWRWRCEGVESQNGTLSLRYNKFNNRGGNKGNPKDKTIKSKCQPFQVLGSWMARLTMWQLGLGEAVFEGETDIDMSNPDALCVAINNMD